MGDFEKLINASDLIEWIMETYTDWCEGTVRSIVDHVEHMPSAQPELSEWCHDCKEYDPEKGCCPRWGQVIRTALEEAKPEIIRCKDCRWWDKYGDYDKGYCMAAKHGYWSEHWDISIRRTYKGDFYCADAEPKGEQE